jgi:hypothetical protein
MSYALNNTANGVKTMLRDRSPRDRLTRSGGNDTTVSRASPLVLLRIELGSSEL